MHETNTKNNRNMKVPVGISNRHIHLSKADADALFGADYQFTIKKDLTQPGQYAYNETVTIVGPKWPIEQVRILGPYREHTQIEVLMGDTFKLGMEVPMRLSGDIEGTPWIHIVWPAGEIDIQKGVIIAKRHLHITPEQADERWITNNQILKLRIDNPDRPVVFENVIVRAKENSQLDCHIDVEEGNAAWLKACSYGFLEVE